MLGDSWSQIGAPRVFIPSSWRHPRGPESVDTRAPKSGSGQYGVSQPALCSHDPTVVNLISASAVDTILQVPIHHTIHTAIQRVITHPVSM